MPYDSRVYRVLIASPSDVESEREIAVRVIQEWNYLYSYSRRVVLLPLRWETHTAPEYGTRPQEVINRAIVDQCDLLVGIFWTRIGTPTGLADGGTLEEIERVGSANKPIMLYFSNMPAVPDDLDMAQVEKLREFKKKTYPQALVESYKSQIEFRDKLSRQLEIKVRELQKGDEVGGPPLTFGFLNSATGKVETTSLTRVVDRPAVTGLEGVAEGERAKVEKVASARIKTLTAIPLVLAVSNTSAAGIRNLFVELQVESTGGRVSISGSVPQDRLSGLWSVRSVLAAYRWREDEDIDSDLAKYDSDRLQRIDGSWRLSFEWEALQPQRTRVIKPVLYVDAQESTKLIISARVYADSFPEPFSFRVDAEVGVRHGAVSIDELVPNWKELLKSEESSALVTYVDLSDNTGAQ